MRPRLRSILLSSLLLAQPLAANDEAATQQQLQQLRERIQAVEARLAKARSRESSVSAELGQVERKMGNLRQALRKVDQQLTAQTRRLDQLRKEEAVQTAELQRQRQHLYEQVRAAYILGRQEQLKLLLSQEDPQAVGRSLVYYQYLNSARAERINAVRESLAELARLTTEIETLLAELHQSRSTQQELLAALKQQAGEREQVLAKLRQRIQQEGGELSRMQKDEARLEGLLQELRTALADIEKSMAGQQSFKALKQQLSWPTRGSLQARFGQQRPPGMTWRGVFVAAPANEPVVAVSHGRVAYADWLRGFGLLMIIDHGDGFMSLYGHNQALYREVGDWVEAGHVIASTGDSGGQAATGLYFELRQDGKPVDPLKWLSGQPKPVQTAKRS